MSVSAERNELETVVIVSISMLRFAGPLDRVDYARARGLSSGKVSQPRDYALANTRSAASYRRFREVKHHVEAFN